MIPPGISGGIPGGIGGIFTNPRWDGFLDPTQDFRWDPRWDWWDPASHFYLGKLHVHCTFPCVTWLLGWVLAVVFVIEVPARFRSDDATVGLLLSGGELFFYKLTQQRKKSVKGLNPRVISDDVSRLSMIV